MPENNFTYHAGTLLSNPVFKRFNDGLCYLRFFLVVPRDKSQRTPHSRNGKKPQRTDIIRFIQYGIEAEVNVHYLQKNARVVVGGWIRSRTYQDKRTGKVRAQLEVNIRNLFPGPGCNYELGNQMRLQIAEREGCDVNALTGEEPIPAIPEELVRMLWAEVEECDESL